MSIIVTLACVVIVWCAGDGRMDMPIRANTVPLPYQQLKAESMWVIILLRLPEKRVKYIKRVSGVYHGIAAKKNILFSF